MLASAIYTLAAEGNGSGFFAAFVGIAMWLGGHWHYALRNRFWKSPLAQRIVLALPGIPNPAEGWGVPGVAAGPGGRQAPYDERY